MAQIHELTMIELAAAIRAGELSPVAVTDHYLRRTTELNEQTGAFYTITPEIAADQARAAEKAVADADGWTSSIQRASTAASGLVHDMRSKLDSLATGTDSFAAAMEEVAASSQEQSASTEEIAAAASTLAGAAERLSRLVSNLRLDERPTTDENAAVTGPVLMPSEITLGRPFRPVVGKKVG